MDNKNIKILIIDDAADVRESLKKILEYKGYPVITAVDGEDGLARVKEQAIDIIFCDLVMPKMDGIEFLKHLREFDLKAEVIVITGQSSLDRCVEAIEQNACGYLLKPFQIEDIMKNITRAERRLEEKKEMIRRAMLDRQKKA